MRLGHRVARKRADPLPNQFLERLRDAINEDGRNNREIGEAIGVREYVICRFVNGRGGLNPRSIQKLLNVLGLEVQLVKRPTRFGTTAPRRNPKRASRRGASQ